MLTKLRHSPTINNGFIKTTTFLIVVGEEGFEPPTLWSQTRCATKLRYSPTVNNSCIKPLLLIVVSEELSLYREGISDPLVRYFLKQDAYQATSFTDYK